MLRIIAGETEAHLREGKRPIAAYWRVVQPHRKLNPKFPPGPAVQADRLRGEGWTIVRTRAGAFAVGGRKGVRRRGVWCF